MAIDMWSERLWLATAAAAASLAPASIACTRGNDGKDASLSGGMRHDRAAANRVHLAHKGLRAVCDHDAAVIDAVAMLGLGGGGGMGSVNSRERASSKALVYRRRVCWCCTMVR